MRFETRRCRNLPTDAVPLIYTVTTTPSLPGVMLGTETFTSTAIALFTPSISLVDPTNKAILQALCDKFTLDYLNWRQFEIEETFAGICAFIPNGIIQTMEFTYEQGMCSTRLSSSPYFFPFQELGHRSGDPTADCPDTDLAHISDRTPCIEMYGRIRFSIRHLRQSSLVPYLVCKQDGRYVKTYESVDVYNCTCSTSPGTNCATSGCEGCNLAKADMKIGGLLGLWVCLGTMYDILHTYHPLHHLANGCDLYDCPSSEVSFDITATLHYSPFGPTWISDCIPLSRIWYRASWRSNSIHI